jgi:hypothetical protein
MLEIASVTSPVAVSKLHLPTEILILNGAQSFGNLQKVYRAKCKTVDQCSFTAKKKNISSPFHRHKSNLED